MITPMQIQNKEFSRTVRGYKEEEVDVFLDQITMELENLIRENQQLKAEFEKLRSENEKLQNSEDAVLDTLEAAKALMGDISASAEKRAEIVTKNAELDADLIIRQAREEYERQEEQTGVLRDNYNTFKNKYKTLLESELQRFETLTNDIFPDFEITGLEDLENDKDKEGKAEQHKSSAIFDDGGDRKTMIIK